MGIQRCKECKRKFTYIDFQKSLLTGYGPVICTECGKKYVWKISYRLIFALLIAAPIGFTIYSSSVVITALGYILSLIIILALFPFLNIYKPEDELI